MLNGGSARDERAYDAASDAVLLERSARGESTPAVAAARCAFRACADTALVLVSREAIPPHPTLYAPDIRRPCRCAARIVRDSPTRNLGALKEMARAEIHVHTVPRTCASVHAFLA